MRGGGEGGEERGERRVVQVSKTRRKVVVGGSQDVAAVLKPDAAHCSLNDEATTTRMTRMTTRMTTMTTMTTIE